MTIEEIPILDDLKKILSRIVTQDTPLHIFVVKNMINGIALKEIK